MNSRFFSQRLGAAFGPALAAMIASTSPAQSNPPVAAALDPSLPTRSEINDMASQDWRVPETACRYLKIAEDTRKERTANPQDWSMSGQNFTNAKVAEGITKRAIEEVILENAFPGRAYNNLLDATDQFQKDLDAVPYHWDKERGMVHSPNDQRKADQILANRDEAYARAMLIQQIGAKKLETCHP